MNSMTPISSTARPETAHSALIAAGNATPTDVAGTGGAHLPYARATDQEPIP